MTQPPHEIALFASIKSHAKYDLVLNNNFCLWRLGPAIEHTKGIPEEPS